MEIKNTRRFLLATFAGGLAFFGIKKVTHIFGFSNINRNNEEGKLVVKPHQDAVNRIKGGNV